MVAEDKLRTAHESMVQQYMQPLHLGQWHQLQLDRRSGGPDKPQALPLILLLDDADKAPDAEGPRLASLEEQDFA